MSNRQDIRRVMRERNGRQDKLNKLDKLSEEAEQADSTIVIETQYIITKYLLGSYGGQNTNTPARNTKWNL